SVPIPHQKARQLPGISIMLNKAFEVGTGMVVAGFPYKFNRFRRIVRTLPVRIREACHRISQDFLQTNLAPMYLIPLHSNGMGRQDRMFSGMGPHFYESTLRETTDFLSR